MNEGVGPLPRATGKLSILLGLVVVVALGVAAVVASPSSNPNAPVDSETLTLSGDPNGLEEPARLTVGDPAPDFTVPLLAGGTFSLAEHLANDGRPIVLNFWASWCGPCREEMPDFDLISQEKPSLLVLGVAISDTPEAAEAFATSIGVSYPLAIDNAGDVNNKYPSLGLPTTWLIASDGTLRQELIGQVDAQRLREAISAEFGF